MRLLQLTPLILVCACAKIERGTELSTKDIKQLKSLGLLNDGEQVYRFYSNNNGVRGAGNFYTTQRIAHYWLAENQEVEFAYYKDVACLRTVYNPPGDFVIPYLLVVRKDSSQFKVYAEGSRAEVTAFFTDCRQHWQAGQ